jgi:hypothetical protein
MDVITGHDRTHQHCEALMKKSMAIALLIALVCPGAMADWKWKACKGHHTRLSDAQNACTNMDSLECEPFFAEAVGVSDVFHEIANPVDGGRKNFTVVFENMSQENCSEKLAPIHERAKPTAFGTWPSCEQRERQEHLFCQCAHSRSATVVPFVETSSPSRALGEVILLGAKAAW